MHFLSILVKNEANAVFLIGSATKMIAPVLQSRIKAEIFIFKGTIL